MTKYAICITCPCVLRHHLNLAVMGLGLREEEGVGASSQGVGFLPSGLGPQHPVVELFAS